jgi:hypothetical protein
MTVGIAVEGVLTFATIRPELADTDVVRPAHDGYWDVLGEGDPLGVGPRNIAYPFMWLPHLKGVYVYSFFYDYYNRIHVYPNPVDFGYVASETSKTFQVWNAYLESQYLDILVETNTTGLTLSGGPTADYWFLGLEAITYTVTASASGPGTVDGGYAFNFTNLLVDLLRVTGTRVILFPFQPNWASQVTERLEWLTAVNEMRDGTEQRHRMRQHPRLTLDYDFLIHHDDAHMLPSMLFGWQGRAWGVPLWHQGQRAVSVINAGAQVIPCDTEGYEFQVGSSIVIYSSPTQYEALTITSITPTEVTTSSTVQRNWPGGTWLFPLRIAFLQGAPEIKKITGEVATGPVQFLSQENLAGDGTWATSYKGRPVLEREPQRKDHIEETWNRRTKQLDFAVGQFALIDKDPFSKAVRKGEYLSLSKSGLTEMRNVLHFAQGRWKSFWAPTFDNDMRLVETVFDNDSTLVIKYIGYTRYVNLNPLRNHIRVQLKNGTVHYRELVGCDDVNTPPGTETLTVDTPFTTGFSINDVYIISFMPLCRLESDSVEIGYTTMHVGSMSLALRPTLDAQTL